MLSGLFLVDNFTYFVEASARITCCLILKLEYALPMVIYKITNRLNGKVYIGQTVQALADRWSDHSRRCSGRHVNRSAIASAIRLYGKENFTLEQIDSAGTLEALNLLEVHYIQKFNSLAPNGYNMELGGDSKRCHEDTKAKISQKLKGRPLARRWTGGNRQRRTDAEKEHLSRMNKGKPNTALYKPVMAVETGTVYESVNAAAKALGVSRVTISGLLKSGKRGRLGLSFKFVA